MSAKLDEYWGKGRLSEREERFRAIMEIYPVKDFKVQLMNLKEILDEVLKEKKDMIREEVDAICIMKKEVEALLSQEQVTKMEFDFISGLVFNGAKMPKCNFLGLL